MISVIDSSQSPVAGYRYDAFGELMAENGTLDQPFMSSTKRYDAGTGLSYYGYRHYSVAIGRWITRDPLGEVGGINLYGFVQNDPENWVDPWGLYRSHWLLRLLVPGQIFYDEGLTVIENGNYGLVITNFVGLFVEQYIFVISLGTEGACSIAQNRGTTVIGRVKDLKV